MRNGQSEMYFRTPIKDAMEGGLPYRLPRRSSFALKHSYCSFLAGMVHCYMLFSGNVTIFLSGNEK